MSHAPICPFSWRVTKVFVYFALLLFVFGDVDPMVRNALEEFYFSTNGPQWIDNSNWIEGDPCANNWFGLECNTGNTQVTKM